MQIFMTGATGYIGGAVARELARAGHDVVALARRPEAEAELRDAGYRTVAGDVRSPRLWLSHLDEADAVIHTASTGGVDTAEADEAVTRAMSNHLEGTDKALVYTSGVWVFGETKGSIANEGSPTRAVPIVEWRPSLEKWLKAAAGRGVRAVIVRPGVVFGGDGGIPGMLKRGELPIVGNGDQQWPLVHVDDLAVLYRLAMERAPGASVLHGVSGHATMAEVAHRVGAEASRTLSVGEARELLGPFAEALALDQRVSAEETRQVTGWEPERPWSGAGATGEANARPEQPAARAGRSR
jgi:nucleoside-diphosphate-sugar epimerase